jgi:D-Tyr-tRNAtyr deacylase
MFHTKEFWYKPYSDLINVKSVKINDSIVAFIHVEKSDEGKREEVINKAIGNLKWLANKNKTRKVVLFPFAHLSNSKSNPETANYIIQKISEKLKRNLTVQTVPFGQFYEFSIHVLGPSLAKVFKDL